MLKAIALLISPVSCAPTSASMTDELRTYKVVVREFASHDFVAHSKQKYVRGDAHSNTVEDFYSVFKRGNLLEPRLGKLLTL